MPRPALTTGGPPFSFSEDEAAWWSSLYEEYLDHLRSPGPHRKAIHNVAVAWALVETLVAAAQRAWLRLLGSPEPGTLWYERKSRRFALYVDKLTQGAILCDE